MCAKALWLEGICRAEQGVRGLSEAGEVKGIGPHLEKKGQCRGLHQNSDVVTSSVEKQHSDRSSKAGRGERMDIGRQKGGSCHGCNQEAR